VTGTPWRNGRRSRTLLISPPPAPAPSRGAAGAAAFDWRLIRGGGESGCWRGVSDGLPYFGRDDGKDYEIRGKVSAPKPRQQ
jgi:hypothetical protein